VTVRVLFFASLKDATGTDELRLDLVEPVPLEGLLATLKARLDTPGFAALTAENVRIAINQVLTTGPLLVQPGDEVAFLPPVTGG